MYGKKWLVSQVYNDLHTEKVFGEREEVLHAPEGICHICRDKREERQNYSCNGALKCGVIT